MAREQRTHLNPEHPNYAEWKQLTGQLAQHRKAMHVLWKRREEILAQKHVAPTAPAPVAQAAHAPTFNAVPAGAPRAPAHHTTIVEKVLEVLKAHPGVVYTSATMTTAIGLGNNLRAPVGEALRALAKKRVVTEIAKNKYAHIHVATEAELGGAHA